MNLNTFELLQKKNEASNIETKALVETPVMMLCKVAVGWRLGLIKPETCRVLLEVEKGMALPSPNEIHHTENTGFLGLYRLNLSVRGWKPTVRLG